MGGGVENIPCDLSKAESFVNLCIFVMMKGKFDDRANLQLTSGT
jgi:hypothetical protein